MPPVPTRRRPPPARGKPESRRNRPAACKRTGLWPVQAVRPAAKREKQSRTALGFSNRFPVGLRLWQCRWGKTPPAFCTANTKSAGILALFSCRKVLFSEVWKAAAFKAKQKPGGTNVFCHRPIFRQTKSAGIPALFLQQDRLRCAARQYTPAKQQKKRVMGIEPT